MAKKKQVEKKVEKKVEKQVKKPRGTVPDEAFVIGLNMSVNVLVKSVQFYNGVGVLDYPGLAFARVDWFETEEGYLVQKIGIGHLDVLREHFRNQHSAKITKITAKEAVKIKNALAAGKPIDKKYYKVEPVVEKVDKKKTKTPGKMEAPVPDIDVKVGVDDLADGSTGGKKLKEDSE